MKVIVGETSPKWLWSHDMLHILQAVYDVLRDCAAARSAVGLPRLNQKRARTVSAVWKHTYEVTLQPVGYDTPIQE